MATATEEAAPAAVGEVQEKVPEAMKQGEEEKEAPEVDEGEGKKEAGGEEQGKPAEKKRKPRSRKPRSAGPHHPPYYEMIKEAILALDGKAGSSPYAIAKHIGEKHRDVLPANFRKVLAVQLRSFAAKGRLVKVKASFKLAPAGEKMAAAAAKKKATATEAAKRKRSAPAPAKKKPAVATAPKEAKKARAKRARKVAPAPAQPTPKQPKSSVGAAVPRKANKASA